MKNSLNLVAVLLAMLASQANASFIGSYDFANWTKSVDGGSISTNVKTDSLKMISSNKGGGAHNQDFTIAAVSSGLVSFNWSYHTADMQPKYDPFGWLLNGVFTTLTKNTGSVNQSGLFSFAVNAGDIFGFRAASTDSIFGAATTKITGFSGPLSFSSPAAVPLPATAWLMIAPMIALLRKRKVSAV